MFCFFNVDMLEVYYVNQTGVVCHLDIRLGTLFVSPRPYYLFEVKQDHW